MLLNISNTGMWMGIHPRFHDKLVQRQILRAQGQLLFQIQTHHVRFQFVISCQVAGALGHYGESHVKKVCFMVLSKGDS